jgi:osmoprotectant transport system substrate-binding protein
MRIVRLIAGIGVVAAAAACGGGSSGGGSTGTSSSAGGCDPSGTSGSALVMLQDDKHLQNSDNIVAVVRKDVDKAPLTTALDKVDTTLTQADLVSLNDKAINQHDDPAQVAKDYASSKGLTSGLSGGSGSITVGAANFAENQVLANIYATVLNAAGYHASVKDVQSREVYEPALEHGQLDVMPEYAATMTEFLNTKDNGANATPIASTHIAKTIAALKQIGAKHGLVPLQPSSATDENAFAVTKALADKCHLTTLSDLANAKIKPLVLGGPPECPTRPYCKPGLEKTYGITFTGFKSLDAGGPLTRRAVQDGTVQVGLLFSSDPAFASAG